MSSTYADYMNPCSAAIFGLFGRQNLKVLINSLGLFLILSVCVAQSAKNDSNKKTRPDLSGTWVLDNSRSEIKDKVVDYVLTIVHREPEIRITKKYKKGGRDYLEELVYYTDGKPEFNSRIGHVDPESLTRWRGNKLVRRSTSSNKGVQTSPPLDIVTTEEWELSTDGKTLTRTIMTSGVVSFKLKYVFNRSS
jgi:hypothetical protein